MECNNDCSTCGSSCSLKCPVCGSNGFAVNTATVVNLTNKTTIKLNLKHYICTSPKCNVVYFDEENNQYTINDVLVPIWFKSSFMNYMVCYCRSIYLKDIVRAVFSLENPTKEEIIKFLGKEDIETNCLINNPISRDCETLFANAIEYALELKQKGE